MNTMTYKGYLGSVVYSEKDNVFFGKIEGINGLVNFEGESVKELTDAFHEAVDDYLAYCKDEGIEPDKSYSGVLNVRLTPAIHRKIAMLARQAAQRMCSDFHSSITLSLSTPSSHRRSRASSARLAKYWPSIRRMSRISASEETRDAISNISIWKGVNGFDCIAASIISLFESQKAHPERAVLREAG